MKFPGFIALLVLSSSPLPAQPFPADSAMATTGKALKKTVLNATEKPEDVTAGGHSISEPTTAPFTEEQPPSGGAALLVSVNADQGTPGVGDGFVAKELPEKPRYLGAWVYVGGESNVKEVGFVLHEKGSGEFLGVDWPVDFVGWKWIEVDLKDSTLLLPNRHFEANGILDEPVDRVSVTWKTSGEGPSSLGISGVTVATE